MQINNLAFAKQRDEEKHVIKHATLKRLFAALALVMDDILRRSVIQT
jgi:hypothetical protein